MTDTILLNECIKNSGLKRIKIAETLGITPKTLRRKIENESDFNVKEVDALCDLLEISTEKRSLIFFKSE